MKVYQKMARLVVARGNCIKTNNNEWLKKHEATLEKLVDDLPHGSGIDGKTEFDFEASNENKLVIKSSYHHMNDGGYYDGWTEFKVIVTPDLAFGFGLKVQGAFPRKYADTRDYLIETFNYALEAEVE